MSDVAKALATIDDAIDELEGVAKSLRDVSGRLSGPRAWCVRAQFNTSVTLIWELKRSLLEAAEVASIGGISLKERKDA